MSLRSRAASCATDSTSEDALSIRSEMIQRKGTRLGGCEDKGHELRGREGGRGAWQESWALCWRGQEPARGVGALGEKRGTLAESERWGWARGTDRRTDTVSSLLRLCSSSLAAAGASPGCAERLSPAQLVLEHLRQWGGAGDAGDALAGAPLTPAHASRRFHLPTARLLSQILGEGWQEEEGEEDDGAGHPPACPEGAG